jgi:hypothetical protein
MKLWVDEDLSPSLVDVAHRHGVDATRNRDRALLGRSDLDVRRHCIDEDRTLVTNKGRILRACGLSEYPPPRPAPLPVIHEPLRVNLQIHGGVITGGRSASVRRTPSPAPTRAISFPHASAATGSQDRGRTLMLPAARS